MRMYGCVSLACRPLRSKSGKVTARDGVAMYYRSDSVEHGLRQKLLQCVCVAGWVTRREQVQQRKPSVCQTLASVPKIADAIRFALLTCGRSVLAAPLVSGSVLAAHLSTPTPRAVLPISAVRGCSRTHNGDAARSDAANTLASPTQWRRSWCTSCRRSAPEVGLTTSARASRRPPLPTARVWNIRSWPSSTSVVIWGCWPANGARRRRSRPWYRRSAQTATAST